MKIHFPGLTELRGIAALVVLFTHVDLFHDLLKIPAIGLSETGMAGHAVTTFFTLSGFLITQLLVSEKKKDLNINIRHFYVRRILRIWPAYYMTILLSLTLMAVGIYHFPSSDKFFIGMAGFIFMAPNVLYTFGLTFTATTPLWSIGVEEQFYLIWPWIVKKINNLIPVLILIIITYLLVKIGTYLIHPSGGLYALIKLTRFDCMAIGGLFGMLITNSRYSFKAIIFHPLTQVFTCLALLAPFISPINLFANLEIELYSIISAIWISNMAMNSSSLVTLNSSILKFFGRLSYGIYVYHLLVISLLGRLNLNIPTLVAYILTILVVTIFAYLSFELIEKKLLDFKKKFTSISSEG